MKKNVEAEVIKRMKDAHGVSFDKEVDVLEALRILDENGYCWNSGSSLINSSTTDILLEILKDNGRVLLSLVYGCIGRDNMGVRFGTFTLWSTPYSEIIGREVFNY